MTSRPSLALRLGAHAAVYSIALFMLAPFAWMGLTALKSDAEALETGVRLLPSVWRWDNFARAWESAHLGLYTFNSIAAAVITTVMGVLHNAAAGFAFAKLRFRGKGVLFAVALSTMMLPMQVYVILAYLVSGSLGYIDTIQGLCVPFLASGFGIFYMRQAVSAVPDSLIEAGRIDGMNDAEVFLHVVAPAVLPAISALSVFTFVFSWNNFFWPLIIADSDAATTLPLAVANLTGGRYVQSWPVVMAALTIVTAPMILVFLVFQRAFVQGVSMTGLKE